MVLNEADKEQQRKEIHATSETDRQTEIQNGSQGTQIFQIPCSSLL